MSVAGDPRGRSALVAVIAVSIGMTVAGGCGHSAATPDGGGGAPGRILPDPTLPDAATTPPDVAPTPPDAAGVADSEPDRSPPIPVLAPRDPSSVFVHLFEWRWTDIARECEVYLGPAGFWAVQVSPPSEHLVLPQAPWWERYQTVGYATDKSRSGTGDEFRDMVRRCAAAGVGIYADAVINHMTAQQSGVGSNGTSFTKYNYPGLYAPADFHMPVCTIADGDYQNAPDRVRNCELLGLADLNTGSDHVRDQIAGYLSALFGMGVHGFRVDAAKHIDPLDLDAILRRVAVAAGGKPYYFFEVIDNGGEAIKASDYLATGQGAVEALDITEFKYGVVADAFLNAGGKTLAALSAVNAGTGLLPSGRAVVFVNNHDTQRASSLYYKDGALYDLATVFMLASPYGYPSLLSSYAFDRTTDAGRAIGPPANADGSTRPVWVAGATAPDCVADPLAATEGWLCEHRRPYVRGLLAFRAATAGAAATNAWDDGNNQIAFGRGDKGFVVINRDTTTLARAFPTGLASGDYCDIYQGGPNATGCSGARITVDATGTAAITVPTMSAVVIHVRAIAGRGQ